VDRGDEQTRTAPDAIRIEPVGRRVAEAGAVLAASLVDAPGGSLRGLPRPGRLRLLRIVLTAATRDAARHGCALAAVESTGRIVGVLLLMPPGTYPMGVRRRARMAATMLRAAIGAPRRFAAFRRAAAARGATLPTSGDWWMLHTIGVHPRAHRRGVATGLLRHGLAVVDGSGGQPCHLHTASPAAAVLFRAFGFAAAAGADGGPCADGSRVVLMTRPAGQRRSASQCPPVTPPLT
jgi:hypothetical protein